MGIKLKDTIAGKMSGSASADKLASARTITIGNKSNDFNGTGNIAFTLSDIGAATSGHNHDSVYSKTSHTHNYAGSGSAGGAANSATKLATARSITIGNKSNNFDGTGNISFDLADIGVAASGHTHNYAGSGSAGGAANSVKTNLIIKLNGGSTEGTNLFTFNGSTAKTINITPSSIGAAGSSHGTHVDFSSTAPKAAGTASVGSEAKVARGDHVHPAQTSVSGNAGTATKLATARTLTIGNTGKTFNGSDNVSWSLSEIGALPTTGGTMTNDIDFQFTGSGGHALGIEWKNNDTNKTTFGAIGGLANAGVGSKLYMGWGSDPWIESNNFCVSSSAIKYKGNKIYHAGDKPTLSELGAAASSHGTHVTYATATPLVAGTAAVGSSSKVAREDHVHPVQTSVSGNAGTATKLASARSITIGNKSNNFDGSGNISFALADIGAAATSHTHNYAGSGSAGGAANSVKTNLIIKLNSGTTEGTNLFTFNGSTAKTINITPSAIGAAGSSHGTHVDFSTTTPKVAGTAAVGSESSVARGDHVHPVQTSVSGNAGSATKLANARNIVIGNKTNSFNGTGNITYTLAEIGAEPIQKTVVSKSISNGKLTLSTDRYQSATITTGTEIVLPSVTAFTEINLFIKDCSISSVILPDKCKWRVDPNLDTGTSFIFTFIYTTQEWLAEAKIYS